MNLPSIKLQVLILTHRCFNLIRPENLFGIFFLGTHFFQEIATHVLSKRPASFQPSWLKCGKNVWHQNPVSEFYFLNSFKSYDPSKKGEGCFIKLQSLTECRKQTRQDNKFPRHGFWEKGVKNSARCSSLSPDHFRVERKRFCERRTFQKRWLYFRYNWLFSLSKYVFVIFNY